ncbi:hypothetical protein ARMGADRAFT_1029135 [Armillaria gallica]|uniref:Uncharacterized protein n=1 Tax=Armillaria gallica TaxID=47427 RepID=A0A2H3DVC1_ARMGA|nr:hypothetical protein ARMGADRAFT_1029135 [Armillaria gallica]
MVTSETLIGSGNTAYMQLCLHVNGLERERDIIVEGKNQLKKDLIAVAAREEVLQDTINKLIIKILPPPPLQPNGLPQLPQAAAPMESKDYPDINFWQQKAYQAFLDKAKGETDDKDDDGSPIRHPYLEHSDGTSVTHDDLWHIGYALKKQWKILKQADLLPVRWGDVDSDAEDYMTITMTNKFETTLNQRYMTITARYLVLTWHKIFKVPNLFDPLDDIYNGMDLSSNRHSLNFMTVIEADQRVTPLEDEQDKPMTTEMQPPTVEPTASTTKKTRVPKTLEVVAPGENITKQNIIMRFWMALDPMNNWLKVDFDAYFAKMPKEEKTKAEKKKDSMTSKKAPRKQKQ